MAGIGVAVVFSLTVLGATRSADNHRANRSGAAAAHAVLATLGLVLSAGIVVYQLMLVAREG